jgi:hypothetical protein
MSRTTRNPVDLIANPTKKVSKRKLHRAVRTSEKESLHRAAYWDVHTDFGLDPSDQFILLANKVQHYLN